jgi:DNA-binding MarR family transcriptional regulator
MTTPKSQPLAALAAADLAPSAATAAVRGVLKANPEAGEEIYRALRAWCWKALTSRRFDSELRAWHDLLLKTASALEARRQPAAAKLGVLGDLLYESIQFGEHEPVGEVLQRVHVRKILTFLDGRAEVERRALVQATGLKSANLSRILSNLQACGLVERLPRGREAAFRLSRSGQDAATEIRRAPPAHPEDRRRAAVAVSRTRAGAMTIVEARDRARRSEGARVSAGYSPGEQASILKIEPAGILGKVRVETLPRYFDGLGKSAVINDVAPEVRTVPMRPAARRASGPVRVSTREVEHV